MLRLLLLVLFPFSLFAQLTYTIDQSIPVVVGDKSLSNPWSGGLNAAQFNTMDLNGDGQQDLVVYDKTSSKISTFLAKDNSYHYAPEFESLFPAEINTFLVLRDYNCDGKKDLFTFGQIGILVFKNVTQPSKPIAWKKLSFYVAPGLKSDVLLTLGFSGKINLLPGTNDLPNFVDMDGDGDLDVLNMKFVSPSQAEYHKNFSMERYGTCDSLDLERQTQNWGGFLECSCGKIAFGSQTCADIGGRIAHTGGKALLTIDLDHDGDQDLLYSEESCSPVYYMQNQGDVNVAVMNSVSLFPATYPVSIQLFPAPYFEDVDFDGIPDLVTSPNVYTRSDPNNDFLKSVWLYKNTGTKQLPVFTFIKKNFLQDDMIEVGDFSAPAFTDIDQDGDEDLFIGRYQDVNRLGSIVYYQNVGTASAPSFKWVTDDFVGISALSYYNIKPQFIDVDRNGGIDLVFTATSLINGRTSLYYVLSTSSHSSSFGGPLQSPALALDFNENVTMVDVDQDNHVDVLLGTSTGSLEYWRSTGNNFVLANDKFLGLGDSPLRQNITSSAGDVDGDGRDDLVIGNQSGQLSIFIDFRHAGSSSQPATDLVYDSFSKTYTAKNLGGRARPVIVNLYGTDKPEITVGNTQGGLIMLKNDNGTLLNDTPNVKLFPNPLPNGQSLSVLSDRNVSMEVFTVLGQPIGSVSFIPANQVTSYPIRGIASGIYIARFTSGSKSIGQRFIIQ